jgi:predicted nucleic acid-binding protein
VIVVDTSVWIAALRSASSPEAVHMKKLLDSDEVALVGPVRCEVLMGASIQDRFRLRRVLSALPVFYPETATWSLIDHWIDRAGAAGQHFGFADLLIGALAAERSLPVWSLDSDFGRMESLGFLKTHSPA